VQWHPERLFMEDETAQRLFGAFVQVAAAHHNKRFNRGATYRASPA